jgi:hypothetical protein
LPSLVVAGHITVKIAVSNAAWALVFGSIFSYLEVWLEEEEEE